MHGRFLLTSDLARAAGVHPNTVRLYEEWGYLPQVERSPSGYRMFTQGHLAQLILARTALGTLWPGKSLRESARRVVLTAAAGNRKQAGRLARRHFEMVQEELRQAEMAAEVMEIWAQAEPIRSWSPGLLPCRAARLLGLTPDTLRHWERSGLLKAPRDPANGYRRYGGREIARLRVIRMLRRAGYSVMAVLRLMARYDEGHTTRLRDILDTPREDEEIRLAADRWLSALAELKKRAESMCDQLADSKGSSNTPGL